MAALKQSSRRKFQIIILDLGMEISLWRLKVYIFVTEHKSGILHQPHSYLCFKHACTQLGGYRSAAVRLSAQLSETVCVR